MGAFWWGLHSRSGTDRATVVWGRPSNSSRRIRKARTNDGGGLGSARRTLRRLRLHRSNNAYLTTPTIFVLACVTNGFTISSGSEIIVVSLRLISALDLAFAGVT